MDNLFLLSRTRQFRIDAMRHHTFERVIERLVAAGVITRTYSSGIHENFVFYSLLMYTPWKDLKIQDNRLYLELKDFVLHHAAANVPVVFETVYLGENGLLDVHVEVGTRTAEERVITQGRFNETATGVIYDMEDMVQQMVIPSHLRFQGAQPNSCTLNAIPLAKETWHAMARSIIQTEQNKKYWVLHPVVLEPIDVLGLSIRSDKALRQCGIEYVGDLIRYNQDDLLREPTIGKAIVKGIKEALSVHKLKLDTEIENWPPAGLKHH